MSDPLNPTAEQARFLADHILGEEGTILTVKVRKDEPRGFSVNIRGPFGLVVYPFSKPETVIDAVWAGDPESNCHLHVCWTEVRFARLTETNQIVRDNIDYEWELAFFAGHQDASDPDWRQNRLFWFYLKDHTHKAVRKLEASKGRVTAVT